MLSVSIPVRGKTYFREGKCLLSVAWSHTTAIPSTEDSAECVSVSANSRGWGLLEPRLEMLQTAYKGMLLWYLVSFQNKTKPDKNTTVCCFFLLFLFIDVYMYLSNCFEVCVYIYVFIYIYRPTATLWQWHINCHLACYLFLIKKKNTDAQLLLHSFS